MLKNIKIAISILNWNSSKKTIDCLATVQRAINFCEQKYAVYVFVLDNGSESNDWQSLNEYAIDKSWIKLYRNELNKGFAAGHNKMMRYAALNNYDYIWILNNDTLVEESCLSRLIDLIESDASCGAVSPVVYVQGDSDKVHNLGGVHRWAILKTDHVRDIMICRAMEKSDPLNFWITGAAMLLRVSAISEVGFFDESFFAYYEDNDLCARLAVNGYHCRVAYTAALLHEIHKSYYHDRKSYYFYLMARNEIRFWIKNTPHAWRKPIRYRIIRKIFTLAFRLNFYGYKEKSKAVLQGGWHGLLSISGPPPNSYEAPPFMSMIYKISMFLGKPK